MNLQDLEKILRLSGREDSHKVNTDKLWKRVEPHIPKPKKRKFVWLWFLPGMFFLGMVCYSGIINTYEHEKKYIQNLIDHGDGERSASTEIDIGIQQDRLKTEKGLEKERGLSSDTDENKMLRPSKTNPSFAMDVQQSNSDIGFIQFQETGSKAVPTPFINTNNGEILKDEKPKTDREITSFINKISNGVQLQTAEESEKYPRHLDLAFSAVTGDDGFISMAPVLQSYPVPIQKMNFHIPIPDNHLGYIRPGHGLKKWSVSLGVGSFLNTKSLELSNVERQQEFANRLFAEKPLETWNVHASLSHKIISNLRLAVGLEYSWLAERSTASIRIEDQVMLDNVILERIIDGNQIENVFGTIQLNRTIKKNVKRINTFKWTDIHAELIYSMRMNRINIDVGMGMSRNISFSSSGFWHPDGMTEYDLQEDMNHHLKELQGYSLLAQFGIAYELDDQFGLYARLKAKKQLSSLTQVEYGIKQSFLFYGLEMGWQYNF